MDDDRAREPIAFHLVFRTVDSRVIAPDTAAQRTVARVVHERGEQRGLLAFRAAGDHLHVEAKCTRAVAGKLAHAVTTALTQSLDLPGFAPTYIKPCYEQDHVLEVFFYVLRNAEKHGVTNDPLHEASSVGALLGLRVGEATLLTRVRQVLPEVDRGQLLAVLGVGRLEPAFMLDRLADAAAGAVGLLVLDAGAESVRARGAAVRLADGKAPASAVAEALGISERTARRLRAEPPVALLERAIGLRMGLRAELGTRALLDTPLPDRAAWTPGRKSLRVSPRR